MGERGHQTMLTSLLILMKEVVNAFPQEWANLVPAVEHLMHTAPQGSHGISAHDLSCAWGIACSRDTQLAPFRVPARTPETDIAAGVFTNFRELMGVFTRFSMDAALRTQLAENKMRVERTFEPGEIVFRKLPPAARINKHLFPAPSAGPYEVVAQERRTSVTLKDPKTGTPVDKGAAIPLDQILAGPQRAKLQWAPSEDDDSPGRAYSEMVAGDGVQDPLKTSGLAAGKTRGWGPLAPGANFAYQTCCNGREARKLTIGEVPVNHRAEQQVTVQVYSNQWDRVRVVHKPLYQTEEGYTTAIGVNLARETVR